MRGKPFPKNHIPWILGKKHSEETKKKMSLARRKRVITEETKRKLHASMLGRKILWKDKISKALIGKKCPWSKNNPQTFRKGFTPWNKGKKGLQHHTQEFKDAVRKRLGGKNHWCWKGGITPLYKQRLTTVNWDKIIKEIKIRDYNTCKECGVKKEKLEVHHIVPWRISHDDSLENLILVCRQCHIKLEKECRKL